MASVRSYEIACFTVSECACFIGVARILSGVYFTPQKADELF